MEAEAFDHTPLPWFIRDGQVWAPEGMIAQLQQRGGLLEVVAGDHIEYHLPEMEANGEFIVRAVNSHDRLIEALEHSLEVMCEPWVLGEVRCQADCGCPIHEARAALALARGEVEA